MNCYISTTHRPDIPPPQPTLISLSGTQPAHNQKTSNSITMPPRLQLLSLPRPQGWFSKTAQPFNSPLSFLLPQLQQQSRNAHILASLSDNPGAYSKKIRRGRGPASGKGKTSGRGHKGQKQHGKVPTGFNGGQTPENVVHGERGFTNMYVLPPLRL